MVYLNNNSRKMAQKINIKWVIFLSFFLKLTIFIIVEPGSELFQHKNLLISDGLGYYDLGVNLFDLGIFSMDGSHIEYFRTPGYPIFLGFIFYITKNLVWVVLIQLLLSLLTQLLLYKLIRELVNERAALIGAFVFGVDPIANFYNFTLFSETFLVFILLLSLYFVKKVLVLRSGINFFLCIVIFNLLFTIKPIAILLFVPLSFLFFKEMKWYAAILFLISLNIFNIAWSMRNYNSSGVFSVSSVPSHTLLFYDCAYTEHNVTGKSIEEVQTSYLGQSKKLGAQVEGGYFHSLDSRDLHNCRYYDEIAKCYIKNNWVPFIYIHLKNSILCYFNPGSLGIAHFLGWNEDLNNGDLAANPSGVMGFLHGKSWKIVCLTFILVTYNIFIFILSVYGLYTFLIKLVSKKFIFTFDDYYIVTLILLILVLTFSLGANGNSARFKLPIFPFMLLFTSLGLTDLIGFLRGMKVKSNVEDI
jgi:hypothetical protein